MHAGRQLRRMQRTLQLQLRPADLFRACRLAGALAAVRPLAFLPLVFAFLALVRVAAAGVAHAGVAAAAAAVVAIRTAIIHAILLQPPRQHAHPL